MMSRRIVKRFPKPARMYWKRRKSFAMLSNRKQEQRYQDSLTAETSPEIEITTEGGLVLTTQSGVWITT